MKKEEKELRKELGEEMFERMKSHLYSKEALVGQGSPFSEMLQRMVNAMLSGELSAHLEEDRYRGRKNKRNGKTKKTLLSEYGEMEIETPRDRAGSFEPEIVEKRSRELGSGLDEQILALYGQGNSVEDVRRLLIKIYGVEISAGKISQITDKILPQIEVWQNRELQSNYAIVYLDAVHFKVRKDGRYQSSASYTVYSVDLDGNRDLLGIYLNESEGALRWGMIMEDLRRRGVEDILIACTDDLKGLSQVIAEVYPHTVVQKCVVHQVRNSLRFVDQKDRKEVVQDLRKIYTSPTREKAQLSLETFAVKWGDKYKYIVDQWAEKWDELMAYMDYPVAMRKMIYTTNPVEAVHRVIRKLIKGKAAWVSQTALLKQLYLSLRNNEKSWRKKVRGWPAISRELMALYPTRIKL